MPLQLPNLDDRTYNDLVSEALGLIPTYAPEWTNYNPSDPGITLIELFAYLTELMIYRLNQVTDENKQVFLNLISETKYKEPLDQKTLDAKILGAIRALRKVDRAVTSADFEHLALSVAGVARAHCVPLRNLELTDVAAFTLQQPGNISVVVVPQEPSANRDQPLNPISDLLNLVKAELEPRKLLTTQLHVVGPRYVPIRVRVKLVLKPDAVKATLCRDVISLLKTFFHPLRGGPDGKGWPFGRNIYVSEIYELLDQYPGVDYVEPPPAATPADGVNRPQDEVVVEATGSDRSQRENGQLIAIRIEPDELIEARIDPADITLVTLEGTVTCSLGV
jgi:Baseplate J-like protein